MTEERDFNPSAEEGPSESALGGTNASPAQSEPRPSQGSDSFPPRQGYAPYEAPVSRPSYENPPQGHPMPQGYAPTQSHQSYGQNQPYGSNQPYGQNQPYGYGSAAPNPGAGGNRPAGGYEGYSAPLHYAGGNFQNSPPPPKKPKKNTGLIVLLFVLYIGLFGGLVALLAGGALKFSSDPTPSETQSAATEERESFAPIVENPSTDGNKVIVQEDYDGKALTAAQLYEKNVDCVVFVSAAYRNGVATGSGFIIDSENGYILTNYHVVEDSSDVSVTLKSGDSYPAKVVGGDEINDVAVLKVEAKGLKHVTVGNSDGIRVGDDVLIIGNPLGDLTFTLTKGIVSAVERTINTGEYNIETFQTDTAINSGNSGGPAFDATGAVIGIASAKYAATGIEGIGFCIPINDAMAIARDLVQFGYVKGRPNFGVRVSDSLGYEYVLDENGRRVMVETAIGAKIEEIGKDSCAAKAGLQKGDIVTKLENVKIENAIGLINAKNRYKAGDTVTLEVYRSGETFTVSVTLDEYTP